MEEINLTAVSRRIPATPLQIPEEHLPSLLKICTLSKKAVDQLVEALQSNRIESESQAMAHRISGQVPLIRLSDLIGILSTTYALYAVREFSEIETPEFITDLVASILNSGRWETEVTPAVQSGLRARFERILSVETLRMLSKAIHLQRDGERLYCEAKVLSDIRPLFGGDAVERPLAAVVTHTLKLSYHEGRQHRDFFTVLDLADLQALHETLTRALEKDRELRNLLGESRLPVLGV